MGGQKDGSRSRVRGRGCLQSLAVPGQPAGEKPVRAAEETHGQEGERNRPEVKQKKWGVWGCSHMATVRVHPEEGEEGGHPVALDLGGPGPGPLPGVSLQHAEGSMGAQEVRAQSKSCLSRCLFSKAQRRVAGDRGLDMDVRETAAGRMWHKYRMGAQTGPQEGRRHRPRRLPPESGGCEEPRTGPGGGGPAGVMPGRWRVPGGSPARPPDSRSPARLSSQSPGKAPGHVFTHSWFFRIKCVKALLFFPSCVVT